MPGIVAQINISSGGMPKLAVSEAHVSASGVAGDRQKTAKVHGGPNRAVCLYSEELYQWLAEQGIDLVSGSLGENFTTRGIDLNTLKKGDRLRVGQCIIEITGVRTRCYQLRMWDADLPELIVGRSGWMAKVNREGLVRPLDPIELIA